MQRGVRRDECKSSGGIMPASKRKTDRSDRAANPVIVQIKQVQHNRMGMS